MYEEHDVLRKVFEQACADLGGRKNTLKGPPEWGSLDIKQVLDAQYAFA
jgi:hypothetical protein